MISIQIQCDRCNKVATIMGGCERYNNGMVGFTLPDKWILTNEVYCDSCVEALLKKGRESEKE